MERPQISCPKLIPFGDCPNFRGGDGIARDREHRGRENGTVPFGPEEDCKEYTNRIAKDGLISDKARPVAFA